jgi:hypothetical protein
MVSGDEGQRDPSEKFLLGIVRENSTKAQRRVSKNYAQIDNIAPAFTDGKALKTVTVTVYPTPPGSCGRVTSGHSDGEGEGHPQGQELRRAERRRAVMVDEETAADLVENGLASYPPHSKAAKKAD